MCCPHAPCCHQCAHSKNAMVQLHSCGALKSVPPTSPDAILLRNPVPIHQREGVVGVTCIIPCDKCTCRPTRGAHAAACKAAIMVKALPVGGYAAGSVRQCGACATYHKLAMWSREGVSASICAVHGATRSATGCKLSHSPPQHQHACWCSAAQHLVSGTAIQRDHHSPWVSHAASARMCQNEHGILHQPEHHTFWCHLSNTTDLHMPNGAWHTKCN